MTFPVWRAMRLLALGLCSVSRVVSAQEGFPPLPLPPLPVSTTQNTERNIIKLDILAPIAWGFMRSLTYSFKERPYPVPVLVAYERLLGPRVAVGLEAQTGAIIRQARRTGFSLEGRYYLTPPDSPHWLGGVYTAPRLRYLVTGSDTYLPQPATIRGNWAGTELLLGQQRPASSFWLPGLLTEASVGISYWHRLRPDSPAASPDDTPFMQPGWQPVARVGLGYRF